MKKEKGKRDCCFQFAWTLDSGLASQLIIEDSTPGRRRARYRPITFNWKQDILEIVYRIQNNDDVGIK